LKSARVAIALMFLNFCPGVRELAYAAMSKSASIYETLGSANDAFESVKNLKNWLN
jgi:hypothetical protein